MSKEDREHKKEMARALNELAKKNGGKITPRMIVDAARNTKSPLHEYFEWDDVKASELYREMQARTLLRSIPLKVSTESVAFDVSAYVRDPAADPSEQGYVQITSLKSQADVSRDHLVAEFSRAAAALKRARQHAIFFGMSEDIDAIERSVTNARAKISDAPINDLAV